MGKKTITKAEYYQLIGILLAGRKQTQVLETLEKATADIINLEDDGDAYDRGGWLFTDHAWDDANYETTVTEFLKNHHIKIVDI